MKLRELLEAADELHDSYGRQWRKDDKYYAYKDARSELDLDWMESVERPELDLDWMQSVRVIPLRPDDVIVVKMDRRITVQQAERIQSYFGEALEIPPERILIVPPEVADVGILRPEEAAELNS
jgi:hypothetical protein